MYGGQPGGALCAAGIRAPFCKRRLRQTQGYEINVRNRNWSTCPGNLHAFIKWVEWVITVIKFCYLLFNFASYWAFRLFEFSNGSWSVFCNFHLFEFSTDNVHRLPLLLNSFLPEYQVCVAQYFLSNHIFELPEFSFHYDLRFVSSFGGLSEISIADECFASLFSC